MVMQSLNYGGSCARKPNYQVGSNSILINQSSQQNLPSQFYDAAGSQNSTSFQLHAHNAKSAAGGKRIGLSRGSIETSSAMQYQNVNQSQVVTTSSNFLPNNS